MTATLPDVHEVPCSAGSPATKPKTRPALHRIDGPPAQEDPHVAWAVTAATTWLTDGGATLAVTGVAGTGRSRVLRAVAARLNRDPQSRLLAQSIRVPGSTRHLLHQVARFASDSAIRPIVLLVDDFDRAAPADQAAVFALPRQHRQLRLVVTATRSDQFDGVVELVLPHLRGGLDVSVADLSAFTDTQIVRHLLSCLRRRNPAFAIDQAQHARLARVLSATFGVPSDVEVAAGLIDRFGLTAVCDAISEPAPRHHLSELVAKLGPGDRTAEVELSPDVTVVLAAIFAAPGGATTEMLREALPRCDVDASTRALIDDGLVLGTREPADDELRDVCSRYHVRLSAMPAASWCSCQTDVSLAALQHAQTDYLTSRIRRMVGRLYAESQRAVFSEFRQELPNLQASVSALIDTGRVQQAIGLMTEAVPLLTRTCGVATLQPNLLRVLRADAMAHEDRPLLDKLAVRVFAAVGEQEAAAAHLEHLQQSCPADPDPDTGYLAALAADRGPASSDGPAVEQVLADCVSAARKRRDAGRLAEAGAERVGRLVRRHLFDQAESDCRIALSDAIRCGDAYAAGSMLLWRAVAATAHDTAQARGYVERALAKLRPLGLPATLAAICGIVDRQLFSRQTAVDLAMIVGALSRVEFACDTPAGSPPILPAVEEALSERIGARAVQRWACAGAAADPVEVITEVVKRRYVDGLPGAVELRRCGVIATEVVDPELLNRRSPLTAREAEVASLVATGLTNKQVAFRLHLSEWTVINHLRQVMRKLDCNSRVQVARWVSELDAHSPVVAVP